MKLLYKTITVSSVRLTLNEETKKSLEEKSQNEAVNMNYLCKLRATGHVKLSYTTRTNAPRYYQKMAGWRVYGPLAKFLTIFKTKIYIFPSLFVT